ncbi:MAG: HEAT repeat domain-containing protein [Planctomycetota bacterium]
MHSGHCLHSGDHSDLLPGDVDMFFRKPVVLMLGGLVTVSAIGCSAASVLFTDQRPKQSVRQSSSDRMVAIGRMFEEQGKLDRAEAMYRGAVKKNGRSQEARQLLSDIQTRRRSAQTATVAATSRPARTMGAPAHGAAPGTAQTTHVPQTPNKLPATAAAATPPRNVLPTTVQSTTVQSTTAQSTTAPPAPAPPAPAPPVAAQPPVKTVSRLKTVTASSQPADAAGHVPGVPTPPAPSAGAAALPAAQQTVTPQLSSQDQAKEPVDALVVRVVSLEDVLEAADSPADNTALLVEALRSGDSPEARCLAAALLGECSGNDSQVSAVLQESGRTTEDAGLLLAVLDSQQQHSVVDVATVKNLLRLLPGCEPTVQVQGVTTLRHCSTLSCREECVSTLTSLLESSHATVRAAAALTLSDFRPLAADTVKRLETLSAEDSSEEVRESAAASLARGVK